MSTSSSTSTSTRPKYDDKFSIMVIGNEKVGKTSLIERYIHNKFSSNRKRTIGVDNFTEERVIGKKNILIKIWDTVGQEKYAVMTKSHYKIAHGIVIVCAINNKSSFTDLEKWMEGINDNCDVDRVTVAVIANKNDLEEERTVNELELKEFSLKHEVELFEVSAKDNYGVKEAFHKVINDVYENNYEKAKGFDWEEGNSSSGGKKGCC